MQRLKGVVLERVGSHVVLLTPQGGFKRVKITGRIPDIGEEIRIPVVHKRLFNLPRAGLLAVAAAVILILVASPLLTIVIQPPESALAYVSIDIKPSIELTVSNRYNVLDAQAFNSDGERVLNDVNLKGVNFKEAAVRIKEKALQLGFIKNNSDPVLVSVSLLPDAKSGNDNDSAVKTLVAFANSVFTDSKIEVATIHVPSGIRDKARQKGMSSGQYAVLIEAVNAGLPVTEKDMQEKSVVAAISSVGGQPRQIMDQAGQEDQFDAKERKYLAIASKSDAETPGMTSAVGGTPAIASTDGQTESSPAVQSGDNVGKPAKDKKPGEPVKKTDGPDEQKNTSSGAGTPSVTTTTPDANNDNKDGSINPPNNGTDQKTDDNYMGGDQPNAGQDSSGSGNINDMYKLKPNF